MFSVTHVGVRFLLHIYFQDGSLGIDTSILNLQRT